MASHDTDTDESARTGVCIIRAEADASAGVVITVSTRPDIRDDTAESVVHTATAADALDCVAAFLRDFTDRR